MGEACAWSSEFASFSMTSAEACDELAAEKSANVSGSRKSKSSEKHASGIALSSAPAKEGVEAYGEEVGRRGGTPGVCHTWT